MAIALAATVVNRKAMMITMTIPTSAWTKIHFHHAKIEKEKGNGKSGEEQDRDPFHFNIHLGPFF